MDGLKVPNPEPGIALGLVNGLTMRNIVPVVFRQNGIRIQVQHVGGCINDRDVVENAVEPECIVIARPRACWNEVRGLRLRSSSSHPRLSLFTYSFTP